MVTYESLLVWCIQVDANSAGEVAAPPPGSRQQALPAVAALATHEAVAAGQQQEQQQQQQVGAFHVSTQVFSRVGIGSCWWAPQGIITLRRSSAGSLREC